MVWLLVVAITMIGHLILIVPIVVVIAVVVVASSGGSCVRRTSTGELLQQKRRVIIFRQGTTHYAVINWRELRLLLLLMLGGVDDLIEQIQVIQLAGNVARIVVCRHVVFGFLYWCPSLC